MATTVEQLYQQILGRAPDPAGLAYWQSTMGSTIDPSEVAAFVAAAAPELAAAPAPAPAPAPVQTSNSSGYTPTPTTDPVAQLYTQYLGRTPDTAGYEYWKGMFGSEVDSSELQRFLAQAAIQEPTAAVTQALQQYQPQAPAMNFSQYGAVDLSKLDQTGLKSLLGEDARLGGDNDQIWSLSEQERYDAIGRLDPRYREAVANWQNTPDPLDDLIAQNPGLLGIQTFRALEGTSPDSAWFKNPEAFWAGWAQEYNPELFAKMSPQQQQAGLQWAADMSPGAQSARNDPDKSGFLGTLLTIASLIPSPIQPFAMAANSAYQLGEGNYLSAVLSALGANAALSGTDALVLADAKNLADQGLSLSQISDTLGQTYGMNAVANMTNAVVGQVASSAGGVFDKVTGTVTDSSGKTVGQVASDGSFVGGATGSIAPATPGVSTITPIANPYAGITVTDLTAMGLSAANATTAANALKAAAATGKPVTLTGIPAVDSVLTTIRDNAGVIAPIANIAGGLLQTGAAKDAAEAQAKAQLDAARVAADAARFRPVGVTTRFGSSQYGFDANGNLNYAGYSIDPTIRAQQDQLLSLSGGLIGQFTGSQAATAPMGQAAQGMMSLGNQYLATSPQEQAAKYMAEQNALLRPGNQAELASLQNRLQAQGRLGLAVGGEDGLMATNPEMAAYQNKLEMQQRQLAAAATQGGMDYAKFGAGMVGSGGQMLQDMYRTQTGAYAPYQTALGGAQTIEGLGQNAMDLGMSLGSTTTAANRAAGGLLASGMTNAANTIGAVNQAVGSPWGNLLQGGAQALQNWAAPTQQGTTYDPTKYRLTPII